MENLRRIVRACATKGKTPALTAGTGKQLALYVMKATNSSGGNADIGIFKTLADADWDFFLYPNAGALTEYTADVQAGNDVTFLPGNGDKMIVGAKSMFGMFGINVKTLSTGAGPIYTLKYYNGTSFVTLANFDVFSGHLATGEQLIVFLPPADWAKAGLAGLSTDKYYIEITATTAADAIDGVLNDAWFGEMLGYEENVSDNGSLELNGLDDKTPLLFEGGQSLLPYFGTADTLNKIEISYTEK